jgi:hypothetical protein
VGHPEKPLTLVRSTNACRSKIGTRAPVALRFQVKENSVEPCPARRARNLLSKNDWRSALSNEIEPRGPEVSFVVVLSLSARNGERLTGGAPGPNVSPICNPGEPEGMLPDSDPCEEVSLPSTGDVAGLETPDVSVVNSASCKVSCVDEVPQPLCCEGFVFVVEHTHQSLQSIAAAKPSPAAKPTTIPAPNTSVKTLSLRAPRRHPETLHLF